LFLKAEGFVRADNRVTRDRREHTSPASLERRRPNVLFAVLRRLSLFADEVI